MAKFLVSALLVLFVGVYADGDEAGVSYDANGPVVELTPDNFAEKIKSPTGVFVEFYAPWCGHCKSLAPLWTEAATKHPNKFAAIDADKHTEFSERYGVQGFPTIAFFQNGQKFEYEDERTLAAFEAFDTKMNRPRFTRIESADALAAFAKANPANIIGYFADAASADATAFTTVAEAQFLSTAFGLATGAAAGTKSGEVEATVEGQVEAFPKGSDKQLSDWAKVVVHPVLDELNQQTFNSRVMGSTVGNFILFLDPKSEVSAPLKVLLKSVAADFKGKAQFFHIDGNEFSDFARNVDLGESLPGLVVLDIASQNHHVYEGTSISDAGVRAFVADFLAGKLVRELKSEPIPEPATVAGLTTLTGKTFEELVLRDASKDVLVEFYAPWCGHCKKLAPIYKKVAAYLEPISSVVVAQINMDANELPKQHAVEGFPTLRFYPANDKANVITFEGSRNFKDIVKFIKKSATIAFDLPKQNDAEKPAAAAEPAAEKVKADL